ncbi:MAG: hypothetical protein HY608_06915 [Planctomycetes bacterium]|nr:hypothetical protein [Planctomycetota bacterium]
MGNRLVGCAGPGPHEAHGHRFTRQGVDKIKRFVEAGGYLFTEDWEIDEVLSQAWPSLVGIGGGLAEDIPGPEAFPAPGNASHPYLERVFGEPGRDGVNLESYNVENVIDQARHNWKIDNESPEIEVKDERRVTTLLIADFKNGHTQRPLAITFAPAERRPSGSDYAAAEGGRVLHVLSHFGKQTDASDERSLQNLLVNFIRECMERRGSSMPR